MPVQQQELRALLEPVAAECRARPFEGWLDWVRHARIERRDAVTGAGDSVRIEVFAHWVDDATERIRVVASANHEGVKACVPVSESFVVQQGE